MARKFKSLEVAEWMNNRTYSGWFNRLYSIAISIFEWDDLPDSVDPRFIEYVLFWKGFGLYFNDEELGNLFLSGLISGQLDVYNIPTLRTAIANNGYMRTDLNKTNSVVVYDNYSRRPIAETIKLYAMKLYEIDRTIDVNVKAQKTPVALICEDEKAVLSAQNAYLKYDGNIPVMFATKGMLSNFTTAKTDSPYMGDKLQLLKTQILNECLAFLGVEANLNEKAERLISAEISGNLGIIEAMRLNRLKSREDAARKINKLFGTNISVHFNSCLTLSKLMEGIESGVDMK